MRDRGRRTRRASHPHLTGNRACVCPHPRTGDPDRADGAVGQQLACARACVFHRLDAPPIMTQRRHPAVIPPCAPTRGPVTRTAPTEPLASSPGGGLQSLVPGALPPPAGECCRSLRTRAPAAESAGGCGNSCLLIGFPGHPSDFSPQDHATPQYSLRQASQFGLTKRLCPHHEGAGPPLLRGGEIWSIELQEFSRTMTGRCLASGGEAERKPDTVNEGMGRGSGWVDECVWRGGGGLECEVEGGGAEGSGAEKGGTKCIDTAPPPPPRPHVLSPCPSLPPSLPLRVVLGDILGQSVPGLEKGSGGRRG